MRIDIEIDNLRELAVMGQLLQDDKSITMIIALYLSLVGEEEQEQKFIKKLSEEEDVPNEFAKCVYKWIQIPDIYNHIIETSSLTTRIAEKLMNI